MVMTETKLTASELRLGNWVEFNDFPGKHYTKITIDKLKTIADNPIMHTWYVIPLTHEILKKAKGFRFARKTGHFLNLHFMIELHGDMPPIIYYSGQMLDVTHIQYLHQLQNLYFALTGSELEINL